MSLLLLIRGTSIVITPEEFSFLSGCDLRRLESFLSYANYD